MGRCGEILCVGDAVVAEGEVEFDRRGAGLGLK